MSTRTLLGAPIIYESWSPSLGYTTGGLRGYYYKMVVEKTDTVKRPRPKGVDLLFNPTAASTTERVWTDVQYRTEDPITKAWGINASLSVISATELSHTMSYEDRQGISNQLRSQLKGQHVNLAQALAEYRETASLYADAARSVVGLWRALRLRKLPDALRYKGLGVPLPGHYKNTKWADKWLKFQYGAMPHLLDIQGSLRALEQSRPVLVHAFARRQYKKSLSEKCFIPGSARFVYRNTVYDGDVRWNVVAEVSNPCVGVFTSLGFTNPVHLAYELLPGSFVLDWFLNLGDVLANLDALNGYSRISCTETWRTRSVCDNGLGGRMEVTKLMRTPSTMYHSAWPAWKPSMSWKKVVTSAALLQQVSRSKR